MSRCPYCGAKLYDNDDYCLFCGKKLKHKKKESVSFDYIQPAKIKYSFNKAAFTPKIKYLNKEKINGSSVKQNLYKSNIKSDSASSMISKLVLTILAIYWIIVLIGLFIRSVSLLF